MTPARPQKHAWLMYISFSSDVSAILLHYFVYLRWWLDWKSMPHGTRFTYTRNALENVLGMQQGVDYLNNDRICDQFWCENSVELIEIIIFSNNQI